MRKIASYALAATVAALAAGPATATLRTCSTSTPLYLDVACYSVAHGQMCDVHVQHKCVTFNRPASFGSPSR